jgi:hypothetical protein
LRRPTSRQPFVREKTSSCGGVTSVSSRKAQDMKKPLIALATGLIVSLSCIGYAANQAGQPAQAGEICGVIGAVSAKAPKVKVTVTFGATPELAKEKVYAAFSGTPKGDIEIVNEFKNACGAIAVPYGRDDYGWAVDKTCDAAVSRAVQDCSKRTDSQCFRHSCSCSFGIAP